MKIKYSVIALGIVVLLFWYCFCPLLQQLPRSSGNYGVGIRTEHCVDVSQSFDKATFHEFNVDVFYPTDNKSSSQKFAYQPDQINALIYVKSQGSYFFSVLWKLLLSGVYTYTQPDASISQKHELYPVVIYLPGIGGDDLHNIYLEELASHGYIVIAIQPPSDTTVTVFPLHQLITLDARLQQAMADNDREVIYSYRNQAHERWAYYVQIAIDTLTQLQNDSPSNFWNKLNLHTIGLMGHSHGGAVVTDLCQKNNRYKVGVNLDGWTKTYNSSQSFTTPFLFLLSEQGLMPEMESLFSNNERPDFVKKTIAGAGHFAFNDYILVKQPCTRYFGIVTGNANKVRVEISQQVVEFLDKHLKNKE